MGGWTDRQADRQTGSQMQSCNPSTWEAEANKTTQMNWGPSRDNRETYLKKHKRKKGE